MSNEKRDRKEILKLADTYLPTRRCIGGHLTHATYVCAWCDSDDPDEVCFKEKVRDYRHNLSYYVGRNGLEMREMVEGFKVLNAPPPPPMTPQEAWDIINKEAVHRCGYSAVMSGSIDPRTPEERAHVAKYQEALRVMTDYMKGESNE